MLYIHKASCISPQNTFNNVDLSILMPSFENMLRAIEPGYEGIPPGQLRRMGKAVRLGVGAALPLLKDSPQLAGIILGTANGGMEDCIKFLNQIIDYDEGTLTPTNFVQSTTNAIASQIAFMSGNKGYNITHVHRGLSFENALQDAMMHAIEDPTKTYLLGGVDEISDYNFNIDFLLGCFKEKFTSNDALFNANTPGTIAGEGAAMFLVGGQKENSLACMHALSVLTSTDERELKESFAEFIYSNNINLEEVDVFISGENGDRRQDNFNTEIELAMPPEIGIVRYKHLTGEYPSASAFSLWLACHLAQGNTAPAHMVKKVGAKKTCRNILVYNCYQGLQHSFMHVTS
ncbi:MAG: hypothetical protein EYC69_05155 [Bacteroidetes bacterium]|nr:MAG: hypothetical protein EYC69_05155 [Bacteroidota bacterium]